MIVAWTFEKALRCPDCNTYYEEWDPQRGGHIHAYYPKRQYCMGCKAKQESYEGVREGGDSGSSSTNGLQMYLERNPQAPLIRSPLTNRPIISR